MAARPVARAARGPVVRLAPPGLWSSRRPRSPGPAAPMTHRATETPAETRSLSLGFLLPYGEPADGYFSDTLLGLAVRRARRAGHEARVVRVYYDGRDPARDAEVAKRLSAWLAEHEVDTIVVDWLFDPAPLVAHRHRIEDARHPFLPGQFARRPRRHRPRGRSRGADGAAATDAGRALPRSRRSSALVEPSSARRAPDVSGRNSGGWRRRADPRTAAPARVLRAVLARRHLPRRAAEGDPQGAQGTSAVPSPPTSRRTPSSKARSYRRTDGSRASAARSDAGGATTRSARREVVAELMEQAGYFAARMPELEEIVLGDQAPIRYLAALVRAAHDAGLRPLRWLFAARADVFVRAASASSSRDRGRARERAAAGGLPDRIRDVQRPRARPLQQGRDAAALVASIRRCASWRRPTPAPSSTPGPGATA